jgi:hypothetical protein
VLAPETAATLRARALRRLRPDHPALAPQRLNSFLAAPDLALQLEAVRTLRDGPFPGRLALLAGLARDPGRAERLRAEAIVGLAGAEPRARPVLIDLAADGPPALGREALRSLRGTPLTAPERTRLAASARGDAEREALSARLSSPDRAPGAPDPTDVAAWLALLDLQARPTRTRASGSSSTRRVPAAPAATRSTAGAAGPGRTSRPPARR